MNTKSRLLQNVISKLGSVNDISLPGISDEVKMHVLAQQIVDSIRRIEYVEVLAKRNINPLRTNPNSNLFDPLKAAILENKKGNIDEAFWLLFLATHFGKSPAYGWEVVADIYGARGGQKYWSWTEVTNDFAGFDSWFQNACIDIINEKPKLKFNNHRKYQSLRYQTKNSVPVVVRSYIDYIGGHNSHVAKLEEANYATNNDPDLLFDYFYNGLNKNVKSFSRLGVFDLVTMWAKTGLVEFYPTKAYIKGSTGPKPGVTLLFFGMTSGFSDDVLEAKLAELSKVLSLGSYSMQILEDSLCNWQKNPDRYMLFKG
jgi:hypothetical protein